MSELPKHDKADEKIDLTQVFEGKRILFVGATGFVGKVALSLFLRRYPNIEKMFVLVRPGAGSSAEDRFFRKVAGSPVFDPIREVWGAGFDGFLHEKVVPLPGDAARKLLNFSEADLARMGHLDAIINCAGLVTFDPTLESALRINTYGVQNTIAVARRTGACVIHVSTCFVAGRRSGDIWEDEEVEGFFPRHDELYDEDFSVEAEIADCERLIEQVKARADDRAHISLFRERGAAYLRAEGRDEDEERNIKIAVQRERKIWIATELTALGMERAKHWGWTNTYTYTKSLGEQELVKADRLPGADRVRCCIVRPSIVESSMRYPFPGWNEGFTTTAPLTMLSLMGHRSYPIADKVILDLIPVDQVAAGLVAATGATIAGRNHQVYQLASGDENPFYITRTLGLLGLHKRQYFQKRETGPKWLNILKSRLEPVRVSPEEWRSRSAPRVKTVAEGLIKTIDAWTPRWGAPRISAMAERAKDKLSAVAQLSGKTADAIEMFMPFIHDCKYVFRCDQTRALFASLSDADRMALPWDPEAIDWRHYWLEVHMPGLEKWVFPSLEEEFQAKPKAVYTYKDLVELFDATTKHHRQRTAMRQLPEVDENGHLSGEVKRYTYGDLQEMAARGATALMAHGVASGDRVLLLSENRPEWGITYFAILKAGASVVPVDGNATADEVLNLVKSARVKAAVISDKAVARLFKEGLPLIELGTPRIGFETLFEHEPRRARAQLASGSSPGSSAVLAPVMSIVHRPKADDLASLIFTSGTTGKPKGVMLSHRNFASLLSRMAGIFDIDKHDGLLSVLPLHHTFEFSAGLLMPLMRGAQISYLAEVSAEDLQAAFSEGNVTGMVGVPALWQLLHRKIEKRLGERGPLVERAFEVVIEMMRKLRDNLPAGFTWMNPGKLLFFPVHQRFGGRLRLMISGGSALPAETMKAFRGLGFGLYEGYGMTESSPVLTVQRPGRKLLPGSVGEPLPGIEVKIAEPDANGVGEVVASGPNVMMGYFEDPEATAQTLKNGWLHTGDLGRFEDGRLYIVGRKKEMILGASGENVYPDELEELYRDSPSVKELSIVGLPMESGGETVACLCVPDYEREPEASREGVRDKLRDHFKAVSTRLPLYKRVKVLHLTDIELPKTATRKVKRKLVVEEIQKLERLKHAGESVRESRKGAGAITGATAGATAGIDPWMRDILSAVTGKPAEVIVPTARLDELGFDSLMFTELGVALEAAGAAVPEAVDLTGVETVEALAKQVSGWGIKKKEIAKEKDKQRKRSLDSPGDAEEIPVPDVVAEYGSRALDFGQRMLYEKVFTTKITGRAHLPQSSSFIVAANHASHLDMGLVKMALGEWGPKLVALAAKDYFFEDPVKRAYFENFTNLVPMERHGSLRESLRLAHEVIRQGYVLLIFPEGTRSETGLMEDFKPSIGYLALTNKVDVLPMYLEGTYDAMPKGSFWPQNRNIAAHIGPVQTYAALKAKTEKLPRSEHYREAARIVEEAVRKLAPRGHADAKMPARVDEPRVVPAAERDA